MMINNSAAIIESLKNTLLKEIEKSNSAITDLQNKNKELQQTNEINLKIIESLTDRITTLETNEKINERKLFDIESKVNIYYQEYLNNKTIVENYIHRIESKNSEQDNRLSLLEGLRFDLDSRLKKIEHDIEILG